MDAYFQVQVGGGHWSHGGEAQRDGKVTKQLEGQRGRNEKIVGGGKCMVEKIIARKRESIGIHG